MSTDRFFEESKEQSAVKSAIVSKYFWSWAKVIMPQAQKGSQQKIAYLDLFAGPGRFKDGTKSTPLLILEKAISEAARRLNQARDHWLNPPELVKRVPELVPGFPDRIIPVSEKATAELKKRTLTNLYNERPAWLVQAHRHLDAAVAAAYGWPADISEEEAMKMLLELNLSRSA